MSIDPTTGAAGIIDRVKNILMTPAAEWARIRNEDTALAQLLTGYIVPLAAVSALAAVIGTFWITGFFFGGSALITVVVGALIQVGVAALGVFVWGWLINALAPNFGAEQNQQKAFQLSAYSATAALVAGISMLLPLLAPLVMLAGLVYSLALLYIGLPIMMKAPEDKRVAYFITIVVVALVAGLVLSYVYSSLMFSMRVSPYGL
jgi:hypothetical protein